MARWLVAGACGWPLVLAAALWRELVDPSSKFAALVYLACSRICHQRPDRSFHVDDVPWPVCGRCLGLYLAAPIGAWLAFIWARSAPGDQALRRWLVAAVLPTAATLILEWTGAVPVTTPERFVAALPLGAAITFVVVTLAANRTQPIG